MSHHAGEWLLLGMRASRTDDRVGVGSGQAALRDGGRKQTLSSCVPGWLRTIVRFDGNTFQLRGEVIRFADIDAPELSEPRCRVEKRLAEKATARLVELLAWDLSGSTGRDTANTVERWRRPQQEEEGSARPWCARGRKGRGMGVQVAVLKLGGQSIVGWSNETI